LLVSKLELFHFRMRQNEHKKLLTEHGLKVTHQRLAVLEALMELSNHPTAEMIIGYVKIKYPKIAVATVYNILDILCKDGIVRKIKTDQDFVRYDAEPKSHHHLYCSTCEVIENYYDEELDAILRNYFKHKSIPDWEIKEITLQIAGQYNKC